MTLRADALIDQEVISAHERVHGVEPEISTK
jgi:hypothetical protein